LHHPQIGDRAAEDLHVLDLSGHDCFFHALFFEEAQHLAELAHANPGDVFSELLDLRIGFFANRSDGNRYAGFARAFEHQKRKTSVTCDETKFHRGYFTTPRLEDSMKVISSWTSGISLISERMRSIAWEVLSFAESSR